MGERLARLAQGAQVLVVTHSPQVAARARNHWQIEKKQTSTSTTTTVSALNDKARVEEVARMLSGAKITREARAAAKTLLDLEGEVDPQSLAPKKPSPKKRAPTKRVPTKRAPKKNAVAV